MDGTFRLIPPPPDEDSDAPAELHPSILISGSDAASAIVRFVQGSADLVTGGTLAEVPLLDAVEIPRDRIIFDPVRGLFGLAFVRSEGPLAEPRFRHALAMAVDRDAIRERFNLTTLQPRSSLLPTGLSEFATPAIPDWSTVPQPTRRDTAARIVAEYADVARPRLRVSIPPGAGYRILFAHLRRDWRLIGVDAEAVAPNAEADLRLIDAVAPADLVPWYLRQFLCSNSAACSEEADRLLENARRTLVPEERQAFLGQADRLLVGTGAFIPIGQPVRWSLRAPRLDRFRANAFARHAPTELIGEED